MRVTKSGFDKITAILPGYINQQTADGFCIDHGSKYGVEYCYRNDAQCAPGCHVTVGLNPGGFQLNVPNPQTLHIHLDAHGHTVVPVDYGFGTCTWDVTVDHLIADADIKFGVDPATGKLTVHLDQINDFHYEGDRYQGCSALSAFAEFAGFFLDSFVGQWVVDQLTPTIDDAIQGFLPDPLGVEGMVDVGALLAGISPGTEATAEARVIPGGYVGLENNGLSLGIITGFNADEDIATRTPDLDSEPALCVPPLPAPNFGAPPANLPISSRGSFQLLAADQLAGTPDPVGTDIAMGISETTLDLAGHHAVTSGALCLGVGTQVVNQLTVGTIGILVPSLSELGTPEGKDPLLLVTRPQQALDFEIGDNTDTSPAINIHFNHVEVDLYAFLYERYVRALTLDLSMTVGVKLDFVDVGGQLKIRAMLKGISSSSVQVKVLNSEFVRETPTDLEAVLPTVFDLVAGQLGTIPDIDVPTFAGFQLQNLSIQHVTTSQDDFIALFAGLGASAKMRTLATQEPMIADAVAQMDAQIPLAQPRSTAIPKLVSVVTPPAEQIRGALRHAATGKLPRITVDAPARDAQGRTLEWSYRLGNGMWRPFVATPSGQLVIEENVLALQSKYTVELVSRVQGDYRTNSEPTALAVTVDSVAPRIIDDKLGWTDGDQLEVPLYDLVSEYDVKYGFASPGADKPVAWTDGAIATIDRATAEQLAINGELLVFAQDESGNVAELLIKPFHGQPGEAGCNCDVHGGPTSGGVVLMFVVGGFLFYRRRPRSRVATNLLMFVAIAGASALFPGCSCGKTAEAICEMNTDCDQYCPFGQIGICMNNQCTCELTAGRTGPYSDIAVAPDGTAWVSAYSQTFGDLVMAHVAEPGRIADEQWEWVDGVPDVAPMIPDSKIRGGITDPGPDVGMYTSVAVTSDGTPMVSYLDRDNGSLMFAMKVGETWQKHVVEAGGPGVDGGSTKVGMYTSLTLRSDDNRPGIAYLAHTTDATGTVHAEVRFVAAQSAAPTSAADWQQWKIDSTDVIVDPANPEIYPLPGGLGLFIDSARLPSQAPVVVYYDRANGDLKLSKLDPATGEFTAPVILDGSNGDAGWSPSVTVDEAGVVRVAYVAATKDDFKYITDAQGAMPEIIDNGYRIVGQSPDGLPKPEFHLVGDDATIVMPGGGGEPLAVYQDATTQELLVAQRRTDGSWTHVSIAGHTDPWPGAYGFFASASVNRNANELLMSTWVIDQPTNENWVEVFKRATIVE